MTEISPHRVSVLFGSAWFRSSPSPMRSCRCPVPRSRPARGGSHQRSMVSNRRAWWAVPWFPARLRHFCISARRATALFARACEPVAKLGRRSAVTAGAELSNPGGGSAARRRRYGLNVSTTVLLHGREPMAKRVPPVRPFRHVPRRRPYNPHWNLKTALRVARATVTEGTGTVACWPSARVGSTQSNFNSVRGPLYSSREAGGSKR